MNVGGLIYNMQFVFVMNALLIPLMQLIDIGKLVKMYNKWSMLRQMRKTTSVSNINIFTQSQLNE